MPKFATYVGREGQTSQEAIAEFPDGTKMAEWKGGKVKVHHSKGITEVDVPSASEMIVKQLHIVLQNGVRDVLFPQTKAQTNGSKKRRAGWVE